MKRLFYSPPEKILFYIPNYYTKGSMLLDALYKNLKECEAIIRKFQPTGSIYAYEILNSRSYKGMWVFHTKCEVCPKEAFEIPNFNDWIKS